MQFLENGRHTSNSGIPTYGSSHSSASLHKLISWKHMRMCFYILMSRDILENASVSADFLKTNKKKLCFLCGPGLNCVSSEQYVLHRLADGLAESPLVRVMLAASFIFHKDSLMLKQGLVPPAACSTEQNETGCYNLLFLATAGMSAKLCWEGNQTFFF